MIMSECSKMLPGTTISDSWELNLIERISEVVDVDDALYGLRRIGCTTICPHLGVEHSYVPGHGRNGAQLKPPWCFPKSLEGKSPKK
mmetsp:Transcript_8792/g.21342  ORF Transcript_8792/g.21342 Transcript_8792/m.21342 type:complete len:87 (+) Transcript_8792:555-815(+)